jgi:hypothetical protein
VLQVVSAASVDVDLKLETHDFGGCAIDKTGEPLPPSTLKACQEADAILMGTSTKFFLLILMLIPRQVLLVGQNGEWTPKYVLSQAFWHSEKLWVYTQTSDQQTLHPIHFLHSLLSNRRSHKG